MRIHLTQAGTITLIDPANFRALDVLVDDQPSERIAAMIARIGHAEGDDHIRLSPAVLRFLSPLAGDHEWQAGFDAMIAYAAKAGWVDTAGLVRAHITRNPAQEVIDQDAFRAALRMLAGGISIISTGDLTGPVGMVASSLVSISAEPPLVGFFVHEASSALAPILQTGRFAANILGEGAQAQIDAFVKRPQGLERFASGAWSAGTLGLPVYDNALAVLECEILATQSYGTHRQIVGLIRASRACPAAPLVSFNAGARLLAEVA